MICRRNLSDLEPARHKLAVLKNPKRVIKPGMEVLWSYCLVGDAKSSDPCLFTPDEWQLVGVIYLQSIIP